MTQQDDITQRLNEIHADAGYLFGRVAADGACAGAMAESVRARIDAIKALLSKLRAPVSSIRDGFELTYAVDADDPACASDLSHFTNGWRACIASQVRAPLADERALDLLDTLFTAYENGTPCYDEPDSQGGYLGMAFRIDDDTFRACADLLNKERPRTAAALASAPVAGEAIYQIKLAFADPNRHAWRDVPIETFREQPETRRRVVYAAPQASECECSRKSKAVSDSEAQL